MISRSLNCAYTTRGGWAWCKNHRILEYYAPKTGASVQLKVRRVQSAADVSDCVEKARACFKERGHKFTAKVCDALISLLRREQIEATNRKADNSTKE